MRESWPLPPDPYRVSSWDRLKCFIFGHVPIERGEYATCLRCWAHHWRGQ